MPGLNYYEGRPEEFSQGAVDAGDPTYGDYASLIGNVGGAELLNVVPSTVRWLAEAGLPADSNFGKAVVSSAKFWEGQIRRYRDDSLENLSPATQKRLAADFTSDAFLSDPGSVVMLNLARSLPSTAAAGAAAFFTGGAGASLFASGAVGGLESIGQTLDDIHSQVDSRSNDQLMDIPFYRNLREDGMSEDEARVELDNAMTGAKPLLLGGIAGLTSAFGAPGLLGSAARRAAGKEVGRELEGGILRRTGKAAVESGTGEYIQTGAEELTTQQAAVDVGLQPEIDWHGIASASAMGGLTGAAMGLPAGIPSGPVRSHTNANPRPNPINPPAAAVANAVKPNQASVPARGGNTASSPAVTPAVTTRTGPTSRAATIPGATPNQKKPKVAPNAATTTTAGTSTATAATAPATPISGTVAGVAPGSIAEQKHLAAQRARDMMAAGQPLPSGVTTIQALQGDPTGVVAGPTEVAALNVQVAPTVIPEAPAPSPPAFVHSPKGSGYGRTGGDPGGSFAPDGTPITPTPRTPSQVQQATGVPYAQARAVAEQEGDTSGITPAGTPTGPAPTPAPQVPARTSTPGAGFGAGTVAVSPEAVPIAPARPSTLAPNAVEQPVATQQAPPPAPPVSTAPRVLPVAPTKANAVEIARQNAAREAAAAADAKAETDAAAEEAKKEAAKDVHYSMVGVEPAKGKQKSRINKVLDDAVIARRLLDDRPTNSAVPTTEEGIEALKTELNAVVESAVKQGADLRGQVGHVTTPHSLVWLREAQELVSYLNSKKKIELVDKQKAVARFIDRETRIRLGEGVAVKAERALEAEQAQAAKGKGKGQVTEQTQESDATASTATAKKPISVEGPTETKRLARKAEKGGGTFTVEVPKSVEAKPEEDVEDLTKKSEAIVEQTNAQKRIAAIKAKEEAKQAEARKRGEAKRAEIEARVAEENKKVAEAKAAAEAEAAAKPKPLPSKVKEKVDAAATKAAEEEAAREEKKPPKARRIKKPTTIVAPKASSPAASSADFAAQVKAEVEPNPSDAQLAADNASKAHVSIEGLPLAIETAANTERQIITSTGSRIGRLYKYAYGHILGTKAPDGNPIDIFLGPEAYPGNPKLEGLQVVVIDQVDPDTKLPDEPKVMFGFERVSDPKTKTGAVEAYKDSYPRGEERMGDVTPMTLNQFKQWVKSKKDVKNADETTGAPVSELDVLIAEQTEDDAAYRPEMAGRGLAPRQFTHEAVVKHSDSLLDFLSNYTPIGYASDLLSHLKLNVVASLSDRINGIKAIKGIFPSFANQIGNLVQDVKVYELPDFEYDAVSPGGDGFYDPWADVIVIRERDTTSVPDKAYNAVVVLHEAVHAAFLKATYANPKIFGQMDTVLREARRAAFNIGVTGNDYYGDFYGLRNIDELIAEAISNTKFQAFLESVPASPKLVGELGLSARFRNMWDVFLGTVQKALGLSEKYGTLLHAVMRIGSELELAAPSHTGRATEDFTKTVNARLAGGYLKESDTKPRMSGEDEDEGEVTHTLDDATALRVRVNINRRAAAGNQEVIDREAFDTHTVSDWLTDMKSYAPIIFRNKKERALFPHFAERILALAGDVKVHIVTDEVFENELGMGPDDAAYYSSAQHNIIVRARIAEHQAEFHRTILHEAVHAAFMKVVYDNPIIQAKLEKILAEARSKFKSLDVANTFYGLTDIDELLAEVYRGDVKLLELLDRHKLSPELKKELGLGGRIQSALDALIRLVGQALGLSPSHDTLLAGVLSIGHELEFIGHLYEGGMSDTILGNYLTAHYAREAAYAREQEARSPLKIPDAVKDLRDILPSKVSRLLGSTALTQRQAGDPWFLFTRTMDQLIQLAKTYSRKFYEHLRKAGDTIEQIRTTAERYFNETVPLIRKSLEMERKYKGTGLWQRFVDLVMEETRVQVYADRDIASQTHLGKDTMKGAFPKAKWDALNTEWKVLQKEAPDLMAFRSEAMSFYKDMQNRMSFGIIKATLKVTGHDDPFLAQRLFDGTETEDDILALGKTYDHIKDASELAKVEVYFPQMRRGDQVVRALYKIIPPTNAFRELPDAETGELRTWEFAGKNARARAMQYAAEQDHLTPTVSSVWVDTNTGSRYFNEGQPDEIRVSPKDTDAEQRFRVTVQNRFVEFYESKREAFKVAEELKSNPLVDQDSIRQVVEKRHDPGDRQADLMSHQLRVLSASLRDRPGFQNLSDFGKNQLVQALNVASLRMLSHTRVQSRRQPRTNVLGASRDFTRNMTEYSQSVSGYLAKLDHQEDLNQAMKAARAEADSSNDYGTHGVSVIMNAMEKRVADATVFEPSNRLHDWMNRVLAVSFASKLISPAYNILNSLQVIMITYPALAAKFGAGRAAQMLFRVYRDVGVGQILKGGLVGSKRALMEGPSAVTPSIIDDALLRLKSPKERAMINYIIERGGISQDAGIEISNMVETRTGALGTLDKAINSVSTFGRQMPKSIEAINRLVTSLASYRLEMQRNGGNHEAAMVFAQETNNMTQGNYSHSNAAPIFNHPLGKMSFQFKKYGQAIYGMLGHNIGKAIRNAEPGDRAEALKTLAYMAATHVVMAGALGLPTEPLKWLIIGARTAGVDISWGDVENAVRELASDVLGPQLGEAFTRGIPRALGVDLSARLGMQDLLTYGEPRSADKQDISAFLWDTVGGAPASLAGDWIKGSQALMNGDWGEAAQRFSPVKVVTDAIKSYRVTSEGKKTAAGYESLSPYGAGEAAMRVIGFTPSREAETTEARNYFYSAQSRANTARNDLMHQWVGASPGDRGRLWGQIEKFNYGKTRDEKLTRSDLDKYAKRRRAEEREGLVQGGFRVTRRDRNLYKKVQGTYNASP